MLSYFQAHSIEIWILLASGMLSCRQASNELQVIQVSEAKYHSESNYEGNSKDSEFWKFCLHLSPWTTGISEES